jgi:hypothetical protein
MRRALLLSCLSSLIACGAKSPTPDAGNGFNGTFTIQGAPHGGRYDSCSLPMFSGSQAVVSCIGLPSCSDCSLSITFKASPGTYHCAAGSAAIQVTDPGITTTMGAGASCLAADNNIAGPQSTSCPDAPMNCNQALGDCNVSVDSLSPVNGTVDGAWGHFSGSVSGTLYPGDTTDMNGCIVPQGQMLSVSISGSW